MGEHILQDVLKTAAKQAGLPGKITNHGIISRKIAQGLKDISAGVSDYTDAGGWRSAEAAGHEALHGPKPGAQDALAAELERCSRYSKTQQGLLPACCARGWSLYVTVRETPESKQGEL